MTKSNEEENSSDSDLERALDGSFASSKKRVKSKQIPSSTLAEKVTATIACGAVTTAGLAFFLEAGTAVTVASVLSAIIAPYAAYQQRQLTEVKGLQELHGNLRNQVDELEDHNDDLNATVDDLGETISGLEFVETALSTITETSGKSIAQFAEQVSENKGINDDMTKNLRQNVLQNLVTVMMRCDINKDNHMNDEETEDLIERINSLNIVKLNEDRFRNAVRKSGGSLTAVIEVMKETVTGNDDFFTILE